MVIKSNKDININEERVVTPRLKLEDENNDIKLRPKKLEDYVWQDAIKKHLSIAMESAKIRNSSLEHILLYWPPWLGKTTLSLIVSSEMWVNLKHTSGPAIEKQADIISILTWIQEWDILFIDEIHRLKPQIEEILYWAMEDFSIDIMIGSGNWATSIKMDIPKFTLIGATTKLSMLSSPLRDRFGNILKLDFYNEKELANIILRSFKVLGCDINDKWVCELVAFKSRWTPRIANRFVKIIRDYKTVWHDVESKKWLIEIFNLLWIDELGLDYLDLKILKSLSDNFSWKPVGLNTLASIIGEEENTIEDVIEPYLLKIWFLERTSRWRQITQKWIDHINSVRKV